MLQQSNIQTAVIRGEMAKWHLFVVIVNFCCCCCCCHISSLVCKESYYLFIFPLTPSSSPSSDIVALFVFNSMAKLNDSTKKRTAKTTKQTANNFVSILFQALSLFFASLTTSLICTKLAILFASRFTLFFFRRSCYFVSADCSRFGIIFVVVFCFAFCRNPWKQQQLKFTIVNWLLSNNLQSLNLAVSCCTHPVCRRDSQSNSCKPKPAKPNHPFWVNRHLFGININWARILKSTLGLINDF